MILTPDQLRQFVEWPTGTDADRALQTLLDATEADIEQVMGSPVGAITETRQGGYCALVLSRPIASVTTVTDDVYGYGLALASNDYRFTPGGFVLTRMWNGTYPGDTWGPWVTVVYAASDDMAQRAGAQVGLIKATINYTPGILVRTIGDWSEQYQATNSVSGFLIERGALLASLTPGPQMVVI